MRINDRRIFKAVCFLLAPKTRDRYYSHPNNQGYHYIYFNFKIKLAKIHEILSTAGV